MNLKMFLIFISCSASANPYELEDGYQAVSRAAAENLQASGSGAEANYAQVDLSKKKKNRRPPTDEYAQVDKSKKTKKTPKKVTSVYAAVPLFQNESWCTTFHMEMSLICNTMNMQVKLITITKVVHQDSF